MKEHQGALRTSLILATAIALAVAVAGCADSPATTATAQPAASPSTQASAAAASTPAPTGAAPTAAPSPTPPADVAQLFAATVLDPQYEGAGPISGTVTLGNLEGTLSGSMAVKGEDTEFLLTMDFPGILQTSTGKLHVDGRAYETQDGGPWFEVPASADPSDVGSLMSVVALTVTDQGVVTKAGQQLHHLVPANAGALTAADLGMTDPSMADSTATIEFYARDDGSLAVMSMGVAWTADMGGQSVNAVIAMDVTFAAGDKAVIAPPDEVWTWFTSEQHGYTIGHPSDMAPRASTSDAGADAFVYSSTEFAGAIREHQPKAAADNLGAYVRAFKRATGWKLVSDEATEVAGRPAWRLAYLRKANGEQLYWAFTLLIQGRNGYMIFAAGPVDYQEDVLAFHQGQLSTLSLPGD